MADTHLRINPSRLWRSIEEMASKGATHEGGVCRLALSDADREGRDLLQDWLREMGLSPRVDGVGNILALRAGEEQEAPVLLGSHLDTVSSGGRFDGAAGVLCGLEVLRTLEENGVQTRRPVGLASFTNEEGARYTTDMMGSQVFCGKLSLEEAWAIRGPDGSTVGEELRRIGYLGSEPCGVPTPAAYLELHIEQGPLLDRGGEKIGAVEAITGITWLEVTLHGEANHAGTTPMDSRHDAALAAARIIAALPFLAAGIADQRATCGWVAVAPGVINVIPREATLRVDLRNGDPDRLEQAGREFGALVEEAAARCGVSAETRLLGRAEPQACDRAVVREVEEAARGLGLACRRMTSGAGHDAQFMAQICPTAMIFVPSRGGISHSPEEYSSIEDLEGGANVLLHTALRLAG